MTFTAADVQAAIEDETRTEVYNGREYEVSASQWYSDWWGKSKEDGKVLSINGTEFVARMVDEYGGMDMGSELWVVFEIDGRLFKKYGAYYSHDGSYWDGSLNEVKPVQKTITVFEE